MHQRLPVRQWAQQTQARSKAEKPDPRSYCIKKTRKRSDT